MPWIEFKDSAQVGLSLSVSGSNKSLSTLGGWIKIKHPSSGSWKKLAVTCFHCVDLAGKLNAPNPSRLENWRRNGIYPSDVEPSFIRQILTRHIVKATSRREKSFPTFRCLYDKVEETMIARLILSPEHDDGLLV